MSTEPASPQPSPIRIAEPSLLRPRTPDEDLGLFAEQLDSAARSPEPTRASENRADDSEKDRTPSDGLRGTESETPGADETETSSDAESESNAPAEEEADPAGDEVAVEAASLIQETQPVEPVLPTKASAEEAAPVLPAEQVAAAEGPTSTGSGPELAPSTGSPGNVAGEPGAAEAAALETQTLTQQADGAEAEPIVEATDEIAPVAPTQAPNETSGREPTGEARQEVPAEAAGATQGFDPSEGDAEQGQGQQTPPQGDGESATERAAANRLDSAEATEDSAAEEPAQPAAPRLAAPTATAAGEAADAAPAPTPTSGPAEAVIERAEASRPVEQTAEPSPRVDRPTVDPSRFLTRVARAIDFANDRGGGPIELRLSPPELGSLQVKIELREGVLTASLEAETPAARQTLLDNLPALRDRLEQQQIRIDKFDVDVRDDSGGRGGDYQPRDDNGRRSDRDPNPRDTTTARTPAGESRADPSSPAPPTSTIDFGDDTINLVA